MVKEKNNFFKNVWYAVTNFEKYKKFAYQKNSQVIKYILLFILLFSIIATLAISTPAFRTIINGIEYFEKDFPDLAYENGKLVVDSEEPIYLESEASLDAVLLIDTNASLEEQEAYLEAQKNHQTVILMFGEKAVVKNTAVTAYTTYTYSQVEKNFNLDFNKFDKQALLEKFTGSNSYKLYISIYLFLFAYTFITYMIVILIDIIMLSILALLISMLYKVKLKYSNCIKLSVYALTLPLILQLIYIYINVFTGFTIQYFSIMYDVISYIYIITAIIIMKNDLAKQEVGLIKEEKIKQINDEKEVITNEEVNKQKEKKKKKDVKKKNGPDVEPGRA